MLRFCCGALQSANLYFLIIAILQSIKIISPLTPFTAIAPLVMVIAVSLLREALEDQVFNESRDVSHLVCKSADVFFFVCCFLLTAEKASFRPSDQWTTRGRCAQF